MRFLEHTYIWDWCRTHGYPLIEGEPLVAPRLSQDPTLTHHQRVVHDAAGSRDEATRLAARALTALGPWRECLAWATDWDVWVNEEDWPRYYAWRVEYSERRSLAAVPGHLFERGDRDALTWFLAHAIECGWDVDLLPVEGGRPTGVRIRTSHDEWIALASAAPVEFSAHAG
jgi:hypothetical protein